MVNNVNGINWLYNSSGLGGSGTAAVSQVDDPKYIEPRDRVTISARGKEGAQKSSGVVKDEKQLGSEEKQQVSQLKKRDAEVKAHEQAHMAAGGTVVQGGASYQYERGPDGKMYAVGGEVKIDASPERTPEATIRKMQQVRQAALAPAQPSGTDRAVAARAAQAEVQARSEQSEETQKPVQAALSTATGSIDSSRQTADPNKISAYKADLSSMIKDPSKNTGQTINLSV